MLLLAFCLTLIGLRGQSTFGVITGLVTDASGAIVQNASVEAKSQRTNRTRGVTTGGDGVYQITDLDPDVYTVTVSAKGFADAAFRDVQVLSRQTVRVDAQVAIAGTTTTAVEVRAPITSEDLTRSDSKSGAEINWLALNFRATASPSPLVVANLAPNVQPDSTGNISISGQLPTATSFTLDGVSTQNVRQGGPNRDQFPSVESIQEFRVNSAGNSAEYSQPTDITVVSKSGGNQFHGAGFWFLQQKDWNSQDILTGNIAQGDANSYGATLSGPILKNRTFFLFTYEGVRLDQNTSIQTFTAPTAWRTGDFSNSGSVIFDPLTGAPFPGNIIPANRINPVAQGLLNRLLPAPTSGGNALSSPNYNVNFPGTYSNDGYDGRIDQSFGEKHKAFFRISNRQITSAGANNSSSYDTVLGTYTQGSDLVNYAGSYTWVAKPTLINEFRAGYSKSDYTFSYPLASQGDSIISSLGIKGLPGPPVNGLGGVPSLYFPSLFGGQTSPGHPRVQKNGILELNDLITWNRGRHTIKGGFEFRRLNYQDNITFLAGDEYGDYFFTGAFTGGSSDANAFAGALLGIADQTEFAQNGPDGKPFGYHYGGYIQDEFRFRPNLIITAGIRYEINTPFDDATHQLGNFDTTYPGGRLVVQGQQGLNLISPAWRSQVEGLYNNVPFVTNSAVGLPITLRNTYLHNIQPRLGVAWNSNDEKTTVRAAAGIYSVPVLGAVLYSLLGVDTSNFAGFTSTATAPLIFPNVFPNGSASNPGIPSYRRANNINLKDPRAIQWTMSIDHEIARNTVARVSYTGSHTYNLIYSPDLNQVQPNTVGYAALTATPALRLQNLKYPSFAEVLTRDNGPSSKYEALTLELNRRFFHGLTFTNNYVWSKNLTNALGVSPNSNIGQGGQGDNGANVNNYYDIKDDVGNAPFTRRHRFVNTILYDLPFGRGKTFLSGASRAADLLIGGWGVTGITLLQTGPFLTAYFTNGDPSGTNPRQRSVANQRPDVVSGVSPIPGNQTTANWFNAAAFSIPGNNIGRFGNSGVGTLVGPGTETFSMSIGKNFHLTERFSFRYEAQFANLFNIENLAAPSTNLRSNFGQITSQQAVEQGGPRTIQMTLRLFF